VQSVTSDKLARHRVLLDVVEAGTIAETIAIAKDVANKLLAAQAERNQGVQLETIKDSFDYPLVLAV
jgi:hypothetical protein